MTFPRKRTLIVLTLALAGLLLWVPSASASIDAFLDREAVNSSLFIDEDNVGNDNISVTLNGSTLTITNPLGVTTFNPCTKVDANTAACPLDPPDPAPPNPPYAPVTVISVSLSGSGNQTFTNNTSIGTDQMPNQQACLAGSVIWMGPGNDTVNGGTSAESMFGGAGNDQLNGGGGDDDLDGGDPGCIAARPFGPLHPLHRNEYDGSDTLNGGSGDDTAHYEERTDPLTITLDGNANDGAPGENDNVMTNDVNGGTASDRITGGGTPNTLDGGPGVDTLKGGDAADRLLGGSGDDALIGGPARDQSSCGSGTDEAVVEPVDTYDGDCERTGATPGTNNARAKNGSAKVWVVCPSQEGASCSGKIDILLHEKRVGGGPFSVAAGKRSRTQVSLNGKARNLIRRAGAGLFVFSVSTYEPDGTSQHKGQVLLSH